MVAENPMVIFFPKTRGSGPSVRVSNFTGSSADPLSEILLTFINL